MFNKLNKGYIALTSVLIISAVGLTVAATAALLSIGESQSALSLYKGEGMLATTEGCVEDALMQSQADINYVGGTITRPEGTCQITINSKSGTTWNVTATTTSTLYKRSILLVFDRPTSGYITITSWKEN